MSDTPTIDTFDVAVIGYGPTGLALAHWLGAAGHKTVVIERWPELYALPRAGHVDGEVMRLFQKMGVATSIAAESSITTHTVIRDSDGEQIVRVPAELCDQGWAAHYSLFQPYLERTLDQQVRASGNVTVLQGWQAQAITGGSGEPVQIEIVEGVGDRGQWIPSGGTRQITAGWLIGADGANSLAAQFSQVEVEDLGYRARALVIFAERLDPSVGSTMPDTEVGMVPARPYVALRESGKRFARWEFLVDPAESNEEMSTTAAAWALIAPWGFTPENSRLVRNTVFEFRTLLADNWCSSNVLLAGDAAHRMPPHQGQGMCSGQRDAIALSWRLDLILRGIAEPALLDSYTAERRPHVLQLTRNSVERAKEFWVTDPELARARDDKMRLGLVGRNINSSYGSVPTLTHGVLNAVDGLPVAPAGLLSPQYVVRAHGREMLLDDHIGASWILIAASAAELSDLSAENLDLLKRVDVHVWPLDETADLEDFTGDYATWLERIACRSVLIRPDSYVFGGADDAITLRSVLDALRSQLHLTDVM